ncbi:MULTISPECIES: alpha/beta hydrolase YcfP [Salinivibrio]|uniref:UPF0227 protein BZG73_10830 n=1 Tax=Salinivibrio siamensis TaxID=414286 RepID=A0ABX3K7T6_9GAMM|nr:MULTISPECIES: alpha/beta hydrolase YcfP [Salinivibrio]KKA45670.1 hypothetical protein WN56_00595 [Salinivibrio sp. KP-1]MPS31482.1 alpha/beta hydrolase [Salinivibrio sp. VYel7]MPX90403.1 alpha/beta hydrolase [Salinivibrio sp. VYel1]MPX92877.1 alpha/beta hydrolase [Salinivibrio sp. VYel9]MPX95439.1 alpha/beta hydrolase [Salinivibrio sp. VYel6]
MIIYLHGFDATSPGNHEKVLQLQFVDDDVRTINYSTMHPKHDMQHLLKQVQTQIEASSDPAPLICGVGLGAYWSERIGFLCGIKQVIINPNLHPYENMQGKIDRPEEYEDIATKCVTDFRQRNQQRALVILSREDDVLDSQRSYHLLSPFYPVRWDEKQSHKFKNLSAHLQAIAEFKQSA